MGNFDIDGVEQGRADLLKDEMENEDEEAAAIIARGAVGIFYALWISSPAVSDGHHCQ